MKFDDAVTAMKSGDKVRRDGWEYPSFTYLEFFEWMNVYMAFMFDTYRPNQEYPRGYNFTQSDIDATDWVIVE